MTCGLTPEKLFRLMDLNQDGYLSRKDISSGLQAINILIPPSQQLAQNETEYLANSVQVDVNGNVNYDTFFKAIQLSS
jgi:Ca2+-binding EF-hand superfamily protein